MKIASALAILSVVLITPAAAQTVANRVSCASCAVESFLQVRIEHPSLGNVARVFTDHAGRYWVLNSNGLPSLFDSAGRFITTVGRRGQGPGEIQHPVAIWQVDGDSIAIIDMLGRVTIVDTDLQFGRAVQAAVVNMTGSLVLDWPNAVLVGASIPTQELAGYPLHIVDFSSATAVIRRSFGSDGNVTPRQSRLGYGHVIGYASNGFVTAPMAEHVLTRWTAVNESQFTLLRRPEWFAERSLLHPGNPETPPSPILIGLEQDAEGLLWTFSLIPSPEWRKAWSTVPRGSREIPVTMIDWKYLYLTRIEVIDPNDARLLAVRTLDHGAISILRDQRAAFLLENDDGTPSLRVLQFSLVKQ